MGKFKLISKRFHLLIYVLAAVLKVGVCVCVHWTSALCMIEFNICHGSNPLI